MEQGQYLPSRLAVPVLERFLKEYPEIKDAPKHGKKSKLTAADLTEIGRLKAEGETIKAIGKRFWSEGELHIADSERRTEPESGCMITLIDT